MLEKKSMPTTQLIRLDQLTPSRLTPASSVRRENLARSCAMTGFTLIELVITLALGAILLTIAIPSFQITMTGNRVAIHTNEFISALSLSRSEAIKRGRRVVVCKSANSSSCTTAGEWDQGWIVFVDTDNDANTGSGDIILRVHGPLDGNDTLQGDINVKDYISYSSEGFTRLTTGAFQSGTLTFGLCNKNQKNTIVIRNAGHAHVTKVSCL